MSGKTGCGGADIDDQKPSTDRLSPGANTHKHQTCFDHADLVFVSFPLPCNNAGGGIYSW